MKYTVEVGLSCFAPTIEVSVDVPADRDAEEYIDELLDTVLNNEFRLNAEWNFK